MATLQPKLQIKLDLDPAGAIKGASLVSKDLNNINKAAGVSSGKMSKLGRDIQAMWRISGGIILFNIIRKITHAIQGLISQVVKFNEAMHNVNSIAQLNEKQFSDLNDQLLELAMDPRIKDTPTNLANGLYQIVSAGFSSSDSLVILKASAIAASAGLTTTDVAARAITATLHAYGLGAKDAGAISNDLFQIVNLGVLTFENLANTIGTVLPTASALGVTIVDLGAAYTVMTRQGLSADEATTELNAILTGMLKPTDMLTAGFIAHGEASGMAAIQDLGFAGAVELVNKIIKEGTGNIGDYIANVRDMRGIQALNVNDGKDLTQAYIDMGHAQDGVGATQKALNEQMKSGAFQIAVLKKNIMILAIVIGGLFARPLNWVVRGLAKFIYALIRVARYVKEFVKGTHQIYKSFGAMGTGVMETSKNIEDALAKVPKPLRPFAEWLGKVIKNVKLWSDALVDAFRSGEKVRDIVKRFPEPLQKLAKELLTVADSFGDLVARWKSSGFEAMLADLPNELKTATKAFAHFSLDVTIDSINWILGSAVPDLYQWLVGAFTGGNARGGSGGKFAEHGTHGGSMTHGGEGHSGGYHLPFGDLVVDVGLKAGHEIEKWAGNLYGWVKDQLGIGTTVTGDGTGGPSTDQTTTWGDFFIDVGLKAAGDLEKWGSNIYGWIKSQLGIGSSQGVPGLSGIPIAGGMTADNTYDWGDFFVDVGLKLLVFGQDILSAGQSASTWLNGWILKQLGGSDKDTPVKVDPLPVTLPVDIAGFEEFKPGDVNAKTWAWMNSVLNPGTLHMKVDDVDLQMGESAIGDSTAPDLGHIVSDTTLQTQAESAGTVAGHKFAHWFYSKMDETLSTDPNNPKNNSSFWANILDWGPSIDNWLKTYIPGYKFSMDFLDAIARDFRAGFQRVLFGKDTQMWDPSGNPTMFHQEGLWDIIKASFDFKDIQNPFDGFADKFTGYLSDELDKIVKWIPDHIPQLIKDLINGDWGAVMNDIAATQSNGLGKGIPLVGDTSGSLINQGIDVPVTVNIPGDGLWGKVKDWLGMNPAPPDVSLVVPVVPGTPATPDSPAGASWAANNPMSNWTWTDAMGDSHQGSEPTPVDAPIKLVAKVVDVDTTDIKSKLEGLFGGGNDQKPQSEVFSAKLDFDTGPAAIAYTDVFKWGDVFSKTTFTSTFDVNDSPALTAIMDSFTWGYEWRDATFISTVDANNSPALGAIMDAFTWGYEWDSQVFTASFDVDTSGVTNAVGIAAMAAQDIAALMPHSPAKKGPLSKPIKFDYIADNMKETMDNAKRHAWTGMSNVSSALGSSRRVRSWDYLPSTPASNSSDQRWERMNVKMDIHGNVYGMEDLEVKVAQSIIPAIAKGFHTVRRARGISR